MSPSEPKVSLVKLTQLVWLLFGLLEALIGLRVFLKAIAANPNSPFAVMVYQLSYVFVWPFTGLTRTPAAEGMVLEVPSIIAMFVYAVLAYAVVKFIWIIFDRPRDTTVVHETTIVREPVPVPPQPPTRVSSVEINRTKQA